MKSQHTALIQFPQFFYQDVLNGKARYFLQKSPEVPVYLCTEEHQDELFKHLRDILHRTRTPANFTDEVDFIMEVMFPEVGITIADLSKHTKR